MSDLKLGGEYLRDGFTEIDNVFLARYLPEADATDCKVYLYGLYLAMHGGGSAEDISLALRLTEERVADAFRYWEDVGLVTLTKSVPPSVVYNSVKAPVTPPVKYNAGEYAEFVDELRRVFGGREIPVQDVVRYVELMRRYKIEPNAMLLIARYCLGRRSASTAYILTVAANWAKEGNVTEADVNAKISDLERGSAAMRELYGALGLKSEPSFEDRNMYLYWTKECGFRPDAVLQAAKICRGKGGMKRMTRFMEELKAAGAETQADVLDYQKKKEELHSLAEKIVSNLGAYYASLDAVIETYVSPWLTLGFEPEALEELSRFCLRRNLKTPEGMNVYVEKLYKLGVVTAEGIDRYIKTQAALDKAVGEVREAAGAEPIVTQRDREFYRTFTETWGFSHDVVLTVAGHASGQPFPMTYINKILLVFKENGIFSADKAEAFFSSGRHTGKKAPVRLIEQNYTESELAGAFRSLDEIDPDEEDV